MDFDSIEKEIDSNTILLFGSAPEYAFGCFDDIERLAALAIKYNIGCHSDCCLGSYVIPFTDQVDGYKTPCKFDFRVRGVTTISCDPHKYGYGPKGLSILMFRTTELRAHSFFAIATWTGGNYSTPTTAGSRSGANITGTWAAMMR